MSVIRSTTDQPSSAAMPLRNSRKVGDSTNTGREVAETNEPNVPSGAGAIPASSVEETLRFAKAQYDRSLRRLAD